MTNHDTLIEELCRSATPVRRPLPVVLRTASVATLSLALGWLAVHPRLSTANLNGAGDLWGMLELALTGIAGVAALLCAFEISIAGRQARGLRLAVGSLLAWLAVSLIGIFSSGAPHGSLGDGLYCFVFLLAVSTPMMVTVVFALRRTRALQPRQALFMAGLSIAALSLSLLAFCHPFAPQLIDFSMHLAAAACIVSLMVLLGRRWIEIPAGKT